MTYTLIRVKSEKQNTVLLYIYNNTIYIYRYVPLYTIYFNFICQNEQNIYREEQIKTETI